MLTMMMIDSSEGCDIQIQILFSITNLKDAPDERRQECGCYIPYAICHGSGSCSGDIDDDMQPGKHTYTHTHTQTNNNNQLNYTNIIQALEMHQV